MALFIIFIVSCAGEVLRRVVPLPIPASVYGLLIMLLVLKLRLVRLDIVKPTAEYLLDFMPVIFVVPAVGLMVSFGEFSRLLLPFLVIVVVSTLAVMAATGWTAQGVIRLQRRRKGHE